MTREPIYSVKKSDPHYDEKVTELATIIVMKGQDIASKGAEFYDPGVILHACTTAIAFCLDRASTPKAKRDMIESLEDMFGVEIIGKRIKIHGEHGGMAIVEVKM